MCRCWWSFAHSEIKERIVYDDNGCRGHQIPLLGAVCAAFCAVVGVPLGAAVLASIDKDGELLEWAEAAPSSWLSGLVVVLWPVVVCAHLLLRHNEGDK